jgi:hypothetical protein
MAKTPKPKPLTYRQIERLARIINDELAGADSETVIQALLILFHDIATFPQESAETIANVVRDYLFMDTRASDEAEHKYVAEARTRLLQEGAGSNG